MAQARNLSLIDRPQSKRLFRDLTGWKWDAGSWRDQAHSNREVKLPDLGVIDLTGLNKKFYRSGCLLPGGHLDLEEVRFENEHYLTGWTPGVRRGTYYIHNQPSYLHGSESLLLLVRDQTNNDTELRSVVDLQHQPDPSLPIIVEYLSRNTSTLGIEPSSIFNQVSTFTGIRVNGIEHNGDIFGQMDTSKDEFKIVQNDSDPVLNLSIIEGENYSAFQLNIYHIDLETDPIHWWKVQFSKPNIFRNELSFSDFVVGHALGTLIEGDYAIGYDGTWAEGLGVRVFLERSHPNYGTISYKPAESATLTFNKDVLIDRTTSFDPIAGENTYYLPNFPVLDLSMYQEGELAGALLLDTASLELTVDAVAWTRVQDLTDVGVADDDLVFELDPLWGEIRFGKAGIDDIHGALPEGLIEITWKQVPLIRYDTISNNEIFFDSREDLDPQVNALKHGFLVLDTKRLIPHKITLTALGPISKHDNGDCFWGPLDIPATSTDDILTLRARVTARGNPPMPVANIPVQFNSIDGLMHFSQEFAVTDGDGCAYTESFGKGHFDEYVVAVWMYEPMDSDQINYLNPHPHTLVAHIPEWGFPIVGGDTLIIPETLEAELSEVYLLVTSIPAEGADLLDYAALPRLEDEYLTPFNGKTRQNGLTVVWHTTSDGAEKIVHPTAIVEGPMPGTSAITFPIDLPTGHLIVAYKLVIDRTAFVNANTVEDPILTSNQIEILLSLDDTMTGQWKLPNLLPPDWDGFHEEEPSGPNMDSSRISSAVYMSPNDFEVLNIVLAGDGPGDAINSAVVGTDIDLIGTSFPATGELDVSVFIIKADVDGNIISVKDITSSSAVIDSTRLRITSLPVPPTEEYEVEYWIAVGGFHPADVDGVRKTAVTLTILEA